MFNITILTDIKQQSKWIKTNLWITFCFVLTHHMLSELKTTLTQSQEKDKKSTTVFES